MPRPLEEECGVSNLWPKTQLSDVLKKSERWVRIQPNETYKLVTVRLWGKGVDLRGQVTGAEIAASKMLQVRPNQFILSRIDARNGAFGLIPDFLDGAIVSNDFPVFDIEATRLLPAFLGWMSKTRDFVDFCKAASEGTTNRVRLKEDRFLGTAIPLPPLEEQRRIVAKIDELFAKVDQVQTLRGAASREASTLAKAQLSKMSKRFDTFNSLGAVLYDKPRNGWSARCDNGEDGTPVLGLKAITGYRYDATAWKKTSLPTDPNGHYWLNPGDLLITRSNTPEFVGHAAIYSGLPERCIYSDLMMRVPINEQLAEKKFVLYWLQTPLVREFIEANAKGTSPTMKKISQGTVMKIPFPAGVPIEEQRRIVKYLDGLQSKADELKNFQAETSAELDALLPSILDKAFKGEL